MVYDSKIVFHLFLWIFFVGTNGTVQSECYSHNILLEQNKKQQKKKTQNTVKKWKMTVRHVLIGSNISFLKRNAGFEI